MEPGLRFASPGGIRRVAYWVHLILPFGADLLPSWLPTLAGVVLAFILSARPLIRTDLPIGTGQGLDLQYKNVGAKFADRRNEARIVCNTIGMWQGLRLMTHLSERMSQVDFLQVFAASVVLV